jgi:hypothetical protein
LINEYNPSTITAVKIIRVVMGFLTALPYMLMGWVVKSG